MMAPGEEWLTTRALRLELVGPTEIIAGELLAGEDLIPEISAAPRSWLWHLGGKHARANDG